MSAVLLASLMMGCTRNFLPAPFDAQLTMPSDYVFGWTPALNEFDLAGRPVLFNIGVTDADGFPLPRTTVEVSTGWTGVYLMPEEAVEIVGYPGLPDGINSIDDVQAYCVDKNGNYALVEDWCAWFWDFENSQFYSFAGTFADNFYSDTGGVYFYGPTYVSTQTNDLGIARLVAFIDHVPLDGRVDSEYCKEFENKVLAVRIFRIAVQI